MKPLEDVLADWRGEAAVLRSHGHEVQARKIEELCDQVRESAHEYVTWLNESEAMLRSGRKAAWLHLRFREWERDGHARRGVHGREYRMLIVPQRPHIESAAEAGRRAARRPAA